MYNKKKSLKSFRSIGKWSSMIYRYSLSYFDYQLKSFDISAGQLPILLALYRNENISQETLSRQLDLDKTSLARTIKKMEKEKYITRVPDEHDKRAYNIYLTDKAKKIELDIKQIAKRWTQIIVRGLKKEEKDQFFRFLEHSCMNAKDYIMSMKNEE